MTRAHPTWTATLALALLSLASASPSAQSPGPAPAGTVQTPERRPASTAPHETPPDDPLGRGSPHGAIEGFLEAARHGDYERAADYLELTRIPEAERAEQGPERARQLKQVLDRLLWVEVDSMSSSASGSLEDGLEPDLERVAGSSEQGAPQIGFFLHRAARVPGSDPTPVWRVAASTVAHVPELYARYGPGFLGQLLPESLLDRAVLAIYLWQWLALVLALLLSWVLGWLVASAVMRLLRPLVKRSRSELDDRFLELLVGPLRLVSAVGAFAAVLPLLRLTVPAEQFFQGVIKVLVVASLTWLVYRSIDLLANQVRKLLVSRGQDSATYLIPTGTKALKLALAVLVVLSALDTFGFDITTLIAGLGVGGLAVALALRPTLENVFGGIAVLVDEPVRPGQFCKFGGQVGTVEEVGLRSTRVRTLDRTVISVPNSEFANMQIENFARRDRMRLVTTLGLRYETTADQLRHVIAELRRLLRSHPKVLPDPCRVRFVGFGAFSLDLEVFTYIDTADYNEFLAIREDLFLRMIDVVAASGTGFAFPSSTTYLARDGGLDEEKSRAAEAQVQRWREQGELPYPEFANHTIEELRSRLDWPPSGSPGAGQPAR